MRRPKRVHDFSRHDFSVHFVVRCVFGRRRPPLHLEARPDRPQVPDLGSLHGRQSGSGDEQTGTGRFQGMTGRPATVIVSWGFKFCMGTLKHLEGMKCMEWVRLVGDRV